VCNGYWHRKSREIKDNNKTYWAVLVLKLHGKGPRVYEDNFERDIVAYRESLQADIQLRFAVVRSEKLVAEMGTVREPRGRGTSAVGSRC
jgi:hypothetical protein